MADFSRSTEYRFFSFAYYYFGKACFGLAENVQKVS